MFAGKKPIRYQSEVERLTRLVVWNFLKLNYKKALEDTYFTLSPVAVRAIINFLGVNQSDFAKLIGCQKSKISKILHGDQVISKSQVLLAMERLMMEFARVQDLLKNY